MKEFHLGWNHFQTKRCPICNKKGGIYFDWDDAQYFCDLCERMIPNPYLSKEAQPAPIIPKEKVEVEAVEPNQNWLDFYKYLREEGKIEEGGELYSLPVENKSPPQTS